MELKFFPAPGYALVKEVKESSTTPGGLITTTIKRDDFTRGVVVAVASWRITDAGTKVMFPYEVGTKVAFSGGKTIDVDGEAYHILSRNNVVGSFTNEETA